MAMYKTIEDSVGNTPLVRLKRIPGNTSNVLLAKLEGNNPAGSVKAVPGGMNFLEAPLKGNNMTASFSVLSMCCSEKPWSVPINHIQTWLIALIFLMCAPAFADNANDPFFEIAAKYLAANPKPVLPEEARKFKVQAEFAVQGKQFGRAVELYGQALYIAPWWPEGYFNRALILGEAKKYWDAMREMKRYLLLAPDAPNAGAAQDKIYQWEGVAGVEPAKLEFRDCADCPDMVAIPSADSTGRNFAIGKTEVTQGQWKSIMGKNPSHFSGGLFTTNCGLDCPVEDVSWNDVQEFIQKLNAKTGKQYRLPSEAEWEVACRAEAQQEYCGSDNLDSVAWHGGSRGGTTHPVGRKQPNAFGLYDMSGNVWEWVADCYDGDCAKRVLRGGSWDDDPQDSRAAYRSWSETARESYIGFRLARMLP